MFVFPTVLRAESAACTCTALKYSILFKVAGLFPSSKSNKLIVAVADVPVISSHNHHKDRLQQQLC